MEGCVGETRGANERERKSQQGFVVLRMRMSCFGMANAVEFDVHVERAKMGLNYLSVNK